MTEEMTLEELSARTGEPVEALRRWQELEIIGPPGSDAFRAEDVERARLVQLLLRRGISPEAIARVEKERLFLERYLEAIFPRGVGRRYSLAEAAELAGLELAVARQIWEAGGIVDQGDTLDEEDLTLLTGAKQVLDAGFPLEALLQVSRVFSDVLGRAAEAGTRAV